MASVEISPEGAPAPSKRAGIDYSKFANIEDSDDDKEEASKEGAAAAPVAAPEKQTCLGCGKEVTKPLRCGQCKKAVYCSAVCQKADWPYHKRGCTNLKEKEAEAKRLKEKEADKKKQKDERKKAEGTNPRPKKASEVVKDEGDEGDDIGNWYRHREWKPTAEPKKDFTPTQVTAAAAGTPAEAGAPPAAGAGSAWNAAGTWEDRDVTSMAKGKLQEALKTVAPVDAAGGNLRVIEATDVDGDASKPVIRGKLRHMFDLSFKLKVAFRWMDSAGQQEATGTVEVSDFTNDAFLPEGGIAPAVRPGLREMTARLDQGRRQAVDDAIGCTAWPPRKGTLLGSVAERLRAFVDDYEGAS